MRTETRHRLLREKLPEHAVPHGIPKRGWQYCELLPGLSGQAHRLGNLGRRNKRQGRPRRSTEVGATATVVRRCHGARRSAGVQTAFRAAREFRKVPAEGLYCFGCSFSGCLGSFCRETPARRRSNHSRPRGYPGCGSDGLVDTASHAPVSMRSRRNRTMRSRLPIRLEYCFSQTSVNRARTLRLTSS